MDEETREFLGDIINGNCLLTLGEINQELRRRLPAKPLVYDRTIEKALDGMLLLVKLARSLPANRNRSDVI